MIKLKRKAIQYAVGKRYVYYNDILTSDNIKSARVFFNDLRGLWRGDDLSLDVQSKECLELIYDRLRKQFKLVTK